MLKELLFQDGRLALRLAGPRTASPSQFPPPCTSAQAQMVYLA